MNRGMAAKQKKKKNLNKGKKPQVEPERNPSLKFGSPGAFEVKELKHGVVARFDMPGVDAEDVKVWCEDGKLHFHGESNKQPEYEEKKRVFGGSIEIAKPELYKLDDPKADFKNGVLWVLVPRLADPEKMSSADHLL